jgi:MYXO-CTERM domain-containing protein
MKTHFLIPRAISASFALFILAATLHPSSAAAAPLLGGLGGPAGYGVGNLPANDDGSSAELNVRPAFPAGLSFFGTTYTSLYVNNNGNVSFGGPLYTFTPSAFPIASQPMIAPWWGDVDTRGGGAPMRNGVYWSITPGRFVATWHDVGYYATHDDLQNDFQVILTAAPPGVGDFDVELRYNRCEWTTGDASSGSGGFGGTPAQAGFDAGNLIDYVALPGSLTMRVLSLCTTSNVGIPGVWRFEIRGGAVSCPGGGDACTTDLPGVCRAGTRICISPEASTCRAVLMPNAEACNGLDDDCDGATDEELGTSMCGAGACFTSVANCVGGRPRRCVPLPPSTELCNLIDDDCNGAIDDLPDLTCGVGACAATAPACLDGVPGACRPGTPRVEICNGVDDDCNGVVDDALGCTPPDVGPPDAGMPDGDTPDTSTPGDDAGTCVGTRAECDPWKLGGRAGPVGCGCRITNPTDVPTPTAALAIAVLFLVALRRRSRR